ncbi:hypothetical protein BKA70DRAFT_1404015 [Coprinopsis sp. MPI-PUGE-AT-0042]|nr:hypothetical protein BKA70DRAFT_1404015 [Coprinopsis sp. MPI-PUGE-AT-0042]
MSTHKAPTRHAPNPPMQTQTTTLVYSTVALHKAFSRLGRDRVNLTGLTEKIWQIGQQENAAEIAEVNVQEVQPSKRSKQTLHGAGARETRKALPTDMHRDYRVFVDKADWWCLRCCTTSLASSLRKLVLGLFQGSMARGRRPRRGPSVQHRNLIQGSNGPTIDGGTYATGDTSTTAIIQLKSLIQKFLLSLFFHSSARALNAHWAASGPTDHREPKAHVQQRQIKVKLQPDPEAEDLGAIARTDRTTPSRAKQSLGYGFVAYHVMVLQRQGGDDRSTNTSHTSVVPESRDPIVEEQGYFLSLRNAPRLRYLIRLGIAIVQFIYALLKVILSPYLFWKIFSIYWREWNTWCAPT